MLRLEILLIYLLFAGNALTDYCPEIEQYYQQNTGSFFFKREARTKYLGNFLKYTPNKFKLLSDIYLHYRSIADVSDELSLNLEWCLLDLLTISRHDPSFQEAVSERDSFLLPKALDPVHNFFAQLIVNTNFSSTNKNTLSRLIKLDKLETGFFTQSAIDESYFEPIATAESAMHRYQTFKELCHAVMTLDYYGHYFFINLHVAPAEKLVLLLGSQINTKNLRGAIAAYKEKPTADTYDQIRAAVRALYRGVVGEQLVRSPSEYWEQVLKEAQIIKNEAIAEATSELDQVQVREILEQNLRYAISNSDLSDINEVKASAELIIEALGEPYEQNCCRIRQIFSEQ